MFKTGIRRGCALTGKALIKCGELFGVLAVLVLLAWGGLLARLSYGPLAINPYLTQKLEDGLHDQIKGFVFHVESAQLIWGGQFEPVEAVLSNVSIRQADNTPVLSIAKLGVQFSKRSLIFGHLLPKLVKIYGPTLYVLRNADGGFAFNIGNASEQGAPPEADKTQERTALIRDVLRQVQARDGLGIFDGLKEIDIRDAIVVYEDRAAGVTLRGTDAALTIARGHRGIIGSAVVVLDAAGGSKAAVRADVTYGFATRVTTATVAFSNLVLAPFVQNSAQLKMLAGLDVPLKGSVRLTLDDAFKPASAQFVFGGDKGTFNAPGFYAHALPIDGFYVSGAVDVQRMTGDLKQVSIDLGGAPSIDATATLVQDDKEGAASSARVLRLKGELDHMPMDELEKYWPENLTPDPRAWVTQHLSKGMADKATIDLALGFDPAATPAVSFRDVSGGIAFHGIKVDYLPPLEPVLDAKGTARYDKTTFNLDITGGKLRDMTVAKSVIHITDLHHAASPTEHAHIDIAVALKGPLKTALEVLDEKPLEYAKGLGLKTADAQGAAEVNVDFKFPLHKKLTMDDVKVKADATLSDVMLKNMVAGMTLAGGPMALSVDNASLKVKGNGRLSGMPLTFDWTKYFAHDAPVQSRLKATLPLDVAALKAFGVPSGYGFSGTLPADVDYTQKADKTATLAFTGDLTPFGFFVPALNIGKSVGDKGTVSFTLALAGNAPQSMQNLALKTAGLQAAGGLVFAQDKTGEVNVKKATLGQLAFGDTNISLEAANGGEGGWTLTVNGAQLDASSVFADDGKPNNDAEAATPSPPLHVFMNVNTLITGANRALSHVKLSLERNKWRRIDKLDVDALAGGKTVALRYDPANGGHSLNFQANDAGAALSALGLTDSIRGGLLQVTGHPQSSGARDMQGRVLLTDFTLKGAPLVAKLLNAMSLNGLISLLSGQGMTFQKAQADYFWTDRGQPQQAQNVRQLRIKNGQTAGASLGLSFEGIIDQWSNMYDLNGTIVPVSGLNKALNVIPLVGQVLTAGGEGVIAATYTIKGPKTAPTVTVNPLAALAPGILRKMFFEK